MIHLSGNRTSAASIDVNHIIVPFSCFAPLFIFNYTMRLYPYTWLGRKWKINEQGEKNQRSYEGKHKAVN
ncbi:expressed protein [Echinococcus multilocularis]|uniref:Expressed protein n=1 Tax=Echinococcus multilocularis TaxID=6211 RepID=A0A068Y746_ECHMU|nr:expressed protein [Echinococcus multilocularis]